MRYLCAASRGRVRSPRIPLVDPELTSSEGIGGIALPDTDSLRAFVSVAQTGSMRAAAVELGTSVPSVQRAIGRLERHVGERLLSRSPRGTRLTALGRAQLVNAQRAVYIISEAFGRRLARSW